MTVSEMTAEIRNLMNVTSAIITDAEILSTLNDGYKDVAVKTMCIEHTDIIRTMRNYRYYYYDGIKIHYNGCYTGLVSGYPQYWFCWGQYLVAEPISQDVSYMGLSTSVLPEEEMLAAEEIEGDEADTPHDLPPEFQHLIVDFALYVLSMKLKNWAKVGIYYNTYINNLKKITKEYMERKAEKRAIHKLPGNVVYSGGSPWAH